MCRSIVLLLLLTVAGAASGANLGNRCILPDKDAYVGDNLSDGREGGETSADALVISGLPYSDTGATCDNTDDITLPCADSDAPDVFYSYVSPGFGLLDISLCASGYDCALAVYDSNLNNLACNDDACEVQSQIYALEISAGQLIYIVVDGYSTSCGSYVLEVREIIEPTPECPIGGVPEGEPPCQDDYYDDYNGGCSAAGWTVLCPTADNSVVLCGKSGYYLYYGELYRDTDWFIAYGVGATMTATWLAEFPIQGVFIWRTRCNDLQYEVVNAPAYEQVSISRYVGPGEMVWLWAGPDDYTPCESEYLITVDGLGMGEGCEPSPVESSSWGAIKNTFR